MDRTKKEGELVRVKSSWMTVIDCRHVVGQFHWCSTRNRPTGLTGSSRHVWSRLSFSKVHCFGTVHGSYHLRLLCGRADAPGAMFHHVLNSPHFMKPVRP